jgi:hypothetical protein
MWKYENITPPNWRGGYSSKVALKKGRLLQSFFRQQ